MAGEGGYVEHDVDGAPVATCVKSAMQVRVDAGGDEFTDQAARRTRGGGVGLGHGGVDFHQLTYGSGLLVFGVAVAMDHLGG